MAKEKTTKKSGTGKKLSPYNKFMKEKLAQVKADKPNLTHKEAFKEVAALWKTSKEKAATQAK